MLSKGLQELSPETKNLENFDEINRIELTESEIYNMKWQKFLLLEKERKELARREFQEQVLKPWTAGDLLSLIETRLVENFGFSSVENDGKPVFKLDKNNEFILLALCRYFVNDLEFENMHPGWKLNKGIALMGNVGLGKSLIMRLFANNKRRCFNVISCRDVSSDYAVNGHEALTKYSDTPIGTYDYRTYYQKYFGYCFDDLGTEATKKNFGNELNVMADIILNRYDHKVMFGFECTHITTNLSADEIESFYGTRVRSRFKEMFNPLILTGNDHRK